MSSINRIAHIKDMLIREPHDIFLNYALALELANNFETYTDAEAQFKFVLQLNKHYVPAFFQLGKLFELQSHNQQALHYYKSGLQIAKEQKNNKAINELEEAIFMLED